MCRVRVSYVYVYVMLKCIVYVCLQCACLKCVCVRVCACLKCVRMLQKCVCTTFSAVANSDNISRFTFDIDGDDRMRERE